MNTRKYTSFIPKFIKKLEEDGMSKDVIDISKWVTHHFEKYCIVNDIKEIDMEVIKQFYLLQYDIDIYNLHASFQTVIRRPLLIFMEYYQSGNYYKTHQKSVCTEMPEAYIDLFKRIQIDFINSLECNIKSKKRKLWIIGQFFTYLHSNNIDDIKRLTILNVSEYVLTLNTKYAPATIRIIKTVMRETLNWMSSEHLVNFTGKQAFPLIKKDTRGVLLSTYTPEEITKLLDTIDTTTKNGKGIFFIISLISYLGLRVGDIINLKFENIDWEKNKISINQSKTKVDLTLPLVDEVKYPLLDYIKNGRNPSKDEEYVLSTFYAPYTRMNDTSSIFRFVSRAMEIAGINHEGKHHGPHSLRHSLATNMVNNNVPISAISQVLGHTNTATTEIYITKDTTHLRELSLEVPYAF